MENTVGETVNDTVAETITNSKPGSQEGCKVAAAASGTLQQKVEDVWQPEDIKHTCNSEEDHGIALIRTSLRFRSLLIPAVESGLPFADFFCVLLADAEDVEICEADNEGSWGIQHYHDEQCEVEVGVPGHCTPLKYISMISRFAPGEEGRQEDQDGIQPNQKNTQA